MNVQRLDSLQRVAKKIVAATNAVQLSNKAKRPANVAPSLRAERAMHREGLEIVAAIDEVGRGALGGPVTVGVVVLSAGSTKRPPSGLRDSKLLSRSAREALVPKIRRWACDFAVASATAGEIDQIGIIAALRLAAHRALASLTVTPHCVLLDGNHDYITLPAASSLDDVMLLDGHLDRTPMVRTMVKADLRCSTVAAASILAKTHRDDHMAQLALAHQHYGWENNVGYSTPEHIAAIAEHGPCDQHRRSWSLPGLPVVDVDVAGSVALANGAV